MVLEGYLFLRYRAELGAGGWSCTKVEELRHESMRLRVE